MVGVAHDERAADHGVAARAAEERREVEHLAARAARRDDRGIALERERAGQGAGGPGRRSRRSARVMQRSVSPRKRGVSRRTITRRSPSAVHASR